MGKKGSSKFSLTVIFADRVVRNQSSAEKAGIKTISRVGGTRADGTSRRGKIAFFSFFSSKKSI